MLPTLLEVDAESRTDKKKQVMETFEAAVYALVKSKLLLADGGSDKIVFTKETKLTVNKGYTSKSKRLVITRMNKKEKA